MGKKLELVTIEVKTAPTGNRIPKAVHIGNLRLETVYEARPIVEIGKPLAMELKFYVGDISILEAGEAKPPDGPRIVPVPGIPGAVCELGDIPKSGYNVGQMREALARFPSDTKVGFTTGVGSNLEVLSCYEVEGTAVWFDLGEAE